MRPTLFVHSSSNNQNYRYNVELESIELNCSGVALDPNEIGLTSGNIIL
jgi:hypothetical protein